MLLLEEKKMKKFVFDGLSYAKSAINNHNIDENDLVDECKDYSLLRQKNEYKLDRINKKTKEEINPLQNNSQRQQTTKQTYSYAINSIKYKDKAVNRGIKIHKYSDIAYTKPKTQYSQINKAIEEYNKTIKDDNNKIKKYKNNTSSKIYYVIDAVKDEDFFDNDDSKVKSYQHLNIREFDYQAYSDYCDNFDNILNENWASYINELSHNCNNTGQQNKENKNEIHQTTNIKDKKNSKIPVETNDTINVSHHKKYFFDKEISIKLPDITNKDMSIFYTYEQYNIPTELKQQFKPLGVKSLSKHKDDFNENSIICLNISSKQPIYAMELKSNAKLQNNPLPPNTSKFSQQKLFGQNRLVYSHSDAYGNTRNYIILDENITTKYTQPSQPTQFTSKSNQDIKINDTQETHKPYVCNAKNIRPEQPCIFNGNILNKNAQNAFYVLNLDPNRQYETDIACNLYYTDKNGEKIHTGLSLVNYPIITLSLINFNKHEKEYNCNLKSTLQQVIKHINNGDTAQDRARFFFDNEKCYFTKDTSKLKPEYSIEQNIKQLNNLFNKYKTVG